MLIFLSKILFVLNTLSYWLISTNAQVCPANGILAGIETTDRSGDTAAGRYMLKGKGTINCYGVVREWIFQTRDQCNAGNINFEVWRPNAGSYLLVGVNKFTLSDCPTPTNDVTFGVAPADRIPVEPGYIIGWYQGNLLRISNDPPASTFAGVYATTTTPGPLNPGTTAPFTDQASKQDFSLKVTVTQGEYPTIDNLPATVNWVENTLSSPIVFTVIASHICNSVSTFKDAVQLSFAITSPTGAPFTINNNTTPTNGIAEVTATGAIDYETQNVYHLSITVTGLGLSTSKVLTVNVVDINEEHNITNLPASINVSAPLTPAGTEVFQVLISDPDTNPTTPMKYYLQSWTSSATDKDTPPFVINPDTGSVTSSTDLGIWHLDFPNISPYPTAISYTLNILTTADGVSSKASDLTITITNVKQPPVFLNLPSIIEIDENLPGNTVVYQVLVAASPDPVRYKITDPSLTPFCIDEFSGTVSLCSFAKLDFCKAPQYSIQINATNSVLSNGERLNISVRWISSPPSFTQSVYTGTIFEKCTLVTTECNDVVTFVGIIDRNQSCFSTTSTKCNIIPGKGSVYFQINNCESVVNSAPIDLDTYTEYENIELLLEVRNSEALTGYSKVIVKVLHKNNFTPVFYPIGSYAGTVAENAPGGTSVLTVLADDSDSGIDGKFEYSILPTDPSFQFFEVDPTTGLINTKQAMDRETKSSYTFNVYATDKGSPSRIGSATVRVNITDVNDVRPVIDCSNRPSDEPYPPTPCFYNFDLKYDALIGQNVSYLTLSATDVDPQPNSITFNLLVPDETFKLDTKSGLMSLKNPVNEYTKYLLYVYAKDDGTPSLWSRIMNVRIDTYRPDRQYIDLTVRPATPSFDQDAFLAALRNVTEPWFMKIASQTVFDPNVQTELIVTVYALSDISTYISENIVYQKVFVDRDEMLGRLRTNIYGDPADILNVPLFDDFPVIKVMPTYMNWWLDTVEGIATIVCLSILGLLFLMLAAVGICKWLGILCFKQQSPPKPKHAWVDEEPKTIRSIDEDSVRYRSAHGRRESVSTVHSIILDKDL